MEFMRQYQRIAKFFSWWDRDKVLVKLAYKIIFYFDLEQRASLAIPYGGHCGVAPAYHAAVRRCVGSVRCAL